MDVLELRFIELISRASVDMRAASHERLALVRRSALSMMHILAILRNAWMILHLLPPHGLAASYAVQSLGCSHLIKFW